MASDLYADYSGPASAVEEARSLQDRFSSTGGTSGGDDDDDDDDDRRRSRSTRSAEQQREGSALDEVAEETESPASAVEEARSLEDRFSSTGGSSDDDDGDRDRSPDRSGTAMDEIAARTESPASAAAEAARVRASFTNVSGREQGIEQTGAADEFLNLKDPGSVNRTIRRSEREAGQFIESRFLEENPEFDPEDVRVVRDGGSLGLEFTAEGEQQRRLMSEEAAREALAAGLSEQAGRDIRADDTILRATDEGYTGALRGDVLEEINREQQQAAEGELERQVEEAVGERRARVLGISPALLGAEGARALGDIERGRDFEIAQTDAGLTAEFTPEFQEAESKRLAATSFEATYGVDIDPMRDVELVDTEDGTRTAALSNSGLSKVETRFLSSSVGDIEAGLGVPLASGPVLPERTSYDLLSPERREPTAPDRVVGAAGPLGVPATGYAVPTEAYLGAVGGLGDEARDLIHGLGDPFVDLAREADTGYEAATGEEATFEEAAKFTVGLPVGGVGLVQSGLELPARGIDLAESGAQAVDEGKTDEFGQQFETAAVRAAPVAASGLIGGLARDPAKTTGEAVGALALSVPLLKAGGLPARAVVQPGEELLGYGGGAITRRIAGARTANRLFPNNEPLFLSEEAAARTARAAGRRVRGGVERTGRIARFEEAPFMTRARVEVTRPESSIGEFGGEPPGITGARSEPLGSATEDILDATTGIEGPGLDQPLPLDVRRTRVEGAVDEEGGPSAVPLFEDIREAGGVRPFLRGEEVTGPTIFPSDVEVSVRTRMGSGLGAIPDIEVRRTSVETEQRDAPQDFSNIQGELQRQNLAMRQSLAGEFEGEFDPIGTERGRVAEAARPRVDIEAESETGARRRVETAVGPFAEEATAVGVDERIMQGLAVEPRTGQDVFTELGVDTEVDTEQRQETASELGQELWAGLELDTEFAEVEYFEEFEGEFEFEGEELEVETEAPGRGDRGRDRVFDLGFEGESDESVIDRAFGAGWINKWAVALAGGDLAARQTPEGIGSIAAEEGAFLPLPTEGQVNPDEDLAAGLAAVDEFFFGSGVEIDDDDDDGDDIFARFL